MKKAVNPHLLSVIFISLLQSCNVGNQELESPLTCESILGMWYATTEDVGLELTKDSIFWYAYKFREEPMIADSCTCIIIGDSIEITGITLPVRNIVTNQSIQFEYRCLIEKESIALSFRAGIEWQK